MNTELYLLIGGIALLVFLLLVRRQFSPALPGATVSADLHAAVQQQAEQLRTELAQKELELRATHAQIAARDQTILHLESVLREQQTTNEALQQRFRTEFENVANRLLEEKSRRFTEQNSAQLHSVLTPLREKIREFEANIDRKFLEETREKSGLKREIEQLRDLNQQLSRDAHNLASALKGQSKVQGDWGEMQLEVLLEKAGLVKGIHFLTQHTFRDDDGAAKRPDFIIQLPENRQLIIDAKVSLTAFERFFNENDPSQRDQHLRAHVQSLRSHVENLSRKNYQQLYQINSPDYLLLFVPLESALSTAAQADPRLFTDALERNIVLVTTSSLLATMRTVSHLWKQEKQTRSVLEIARQSGLLYDRFVAFVEDLRAIGSRLTAAQSAYDDAMNKLVNASRHGDTLIGRAEKIRDLGAKASKSLPSDLVEIATEQSAALPSPNEQEE
ncbi:MAG TPA: DNA recombination protein RmuC [Saprospiraceae bacterium]|nr:DNA recombination protein RmuC [Saprospiraceae bacterium]